MFKIKKSRKPTPPLKYANLKFHCGVPDRVYHIVKIKLGDKPIYYVDVEENPQIEDEEDYTVYTTEMIDKRIQEGTWIVISNNPLSNDKR